METESRLLVPGAGVGMGVRRQWGVSANGMEFPFG